eukprot:CAMPEP_0184327890 /NCGR_PEP_ID=MMETSP1049-20130417/143331_1 /TAXON_ID=77928 /ORGANISM="Proteomonas sulcata, Strain CCMP704" /LENGTH=100 /DNA_ID=CAMNT_0026650167 /DNA_START=301 /DNA_END=603 /DNA_ORIENTATION=-
MSSCWIERSSELSSRGKYHATLLAPAIKSGDKHRASIPKNAACPELSIRYKFSPPDMCLSMNSYLLNKEVATTLTPGLRVILAAKDMFPSPKSKTPSPEL